MTATTTAADTTSTFNTGATAFVPKKKIVKTKEEFPDLGAAADTKKKPAAAQKKEEAAPKKSTDPLHGKPTSFFALQAVNPMFPSNEFNNPRIISDDQQKFLFTYYPEYAPNMHALFDWLYETALYNEQQAQYLKEQAEIDKAYSQKPKQGGAKKPAKKPQDDDEEEYTFGGKPIKKPKAPPVKPSVIQEDPEKKRQRE